MGCVMSTDVWKEADSSEKAISSYEMVVFVPLLRIPRQSVFDLRSAASRRLMMLRKGIAAMAKRVNLRKFSVSGKGNCSSTFEDLQKALEEYLPLMLCFAENEESCNSVEFSWYNQEDTEKETAIRNAWYDVLCVLHMMGMVSLSRANSLLIPRADVSEEKKKEAIVMLLRAAGYLEHAFHNIITRLPREVKTKLPVDLQQTVLESVSLQALGQGVEIQLGMAIESMNATLSVKRRLACEQVRYWSKACEYLSDMELRDGSWLTKRFLFLKWKCSEAKAIAYYYHGMLLREGEEAKSMACLGAAMDLLSQSRSNYRKFSLAAPLTRASPLECGPMQYLSKKISTQASNKASSAGGGNLLEGRLPNLPKFPLALKPEKFQVRAIGIEAEVREGKMINSISVDGIWELDQPVIIE